MRTYIPNSVVHLIDGCSSGIHPTFSHRYYRRTPEQERIKLRKKRINKLNKLNKLNKYDR